MSDLFNAETVTSAAAEIVAPPAPEQAIAVIGTPSTELVEIKSKVPEVVFAEGGSEDVLAELRAIVAELKPDISTERGRKAIKSVCRKIASTRIGLDAMGKDLGDKLRKQLNPILEERRKIREGCDEIEEAYRAPLTAWEKAEEARIDRHAAQLKLISDQIDFFEQPSSEQVRIRLEKLDLVIPEGYDWQEFIQRAAEAKKSARLYLEALLLRTVAAEEEEQRLAQIAAVREAEREAELARQRQEREAEIARQAAESAKRAAEEEAARLAEEARLAAEAEAARVAEANRLERERLEREALEAADRAAEERRRIEEKAEADAKAARELNERIERERLAAIERAEEIERQRKADAAAAQAAALAAAQKAEADKIAAIEAERERAKKLAEEADRVGRELAAKRAADAANKRKVHGEARDDLIAAGVDEKTATAVVVAIAKGAVRNVKIEY